MVPRILLTAAFAAVLPTVGLSQTGALITDRPDQTESAVTVPQGLFQFEVGWSFAGDENGGIEARSHSVPEALLRIGIVDRLEGRVGFAGWTRTSLDNGTTSTTASGIGDLDLGFKYQLLSGDGSTPEFAILGGLSIPTGEAGFGSERADPNVRLALAHGISERIGIGYNIGATFTSVPGAQGTETLVDALYTVAVGVTVADRVGAFIESFGTLAVSEASVSQHSLDGGLTFLLADNLQLDVSGGLGLNDAAGDWFVGGGVSFRLPQ